MAGASPPAESELPITATAGTATATISPRRPSWADMKAHYPGASVTPEMLYDSKIGGNFVNLHKKPAYRNTCAVRMSYALARSGIKLGVAPRRGGSPQGGDGHTYWIRVNDLIAELMRRFKGADAELSLPPLPKKVLDDATLRKLIGERRKLGQQLLDTKLNGKNGIVAFQVSGWGDAFGHFTLWDGTTKKLAFASGYDDPTSDNYYFWMSDHVNLFGSILLTQTMKVFFWELK